MDNKAKQFKVEVNGETFIIKVTPVDANPVESVAATTETVATPVPADTGVTEKPKLYTKDTEGAVVATSVGMVVMVKVKIGDHVENGDVVAITEAMKVQNEIHTPHSGMVQDIVVRQEDVVDIDDVLMVVKPDEH
jgi:pyruvate carboxylase subunit B